MKDWIGESMEVYQRLNRLPGYMALYREVVGKDEALGKKWREAVDTVVMLECAAFQNGEKQDPSSYANSMVNRLGMKEGRAAPVGDRLRQLVGLAISKHEEAERGSAIG